METVQKTVSEIHRVLRPGGECIVFEPNKLNPALYLMCLLDREEWGLLALGRKGIYRRLFSDKFEIVAMAHNGLLIGPDSKFNRTVIDIINAPVIRTFLGWLNPKIFMQMKKPK